MVVEIHQPQYPHATLRGLGLLGLLRGLHLSHPRPLLLLQHCNLLPLLHTHSVRLLLLLLLLRSWLRAPLLPLLWLLWRLLRLRLTLGRLALLVPRLLSGLPLVVRISRPRLWSDLLLRSGLLRMRSLRCRVALIALLRVRMLHGHLLVQLMLLLLLLVLLLLHALLMLKRHLLLHQVLGKLN